MLNHDDKAVNDIAIYDGTLYITVTNSDRIYKLDLNQKKIKTRIMA